MVNTKFLYALFFILISTPMILYIHKFGFGLWNSHTRWGELGSFFGGVFGPLFSLISIIILSLTLALTKKSISNSEKFMNEQLNQSNIMLVEQRDFFVIQQFEVNFFHQLQLVIEHYKTATAKSNDIIVNVSGELLEDFDKMQQKEYVVNWIKYLPALSTALEAFDQLVIIVENQAPTDLDKWKYRRIVQSNLHVSFRWFIGQSWEYINKDMNHKNFLAENYGIMDI